MPVGHKVAIGLRDGQDRPVYQFPMVSALTVGINRLQSLFVQPGPPVHNHRRPLGIAIANGVGSGAGKARVHEPAGVDGITPRSLGSRAEELLMGLRDDLKARRFVPQRVRQKTIPKASGKVRSLGIPTVADRVVQSSLRDWCSNRSSRRTSQTMLVWLCVRNAGHRTR